MLIVIGSSQPVLDELCQHFMSNICLLPLLGSSIVCHFCSFNPASPQKCTLGRSQTCDNATYCFTATFTYDDGKVGEMRGCKPVTDPVQYCPDSEGTCKEMSKMFSLSSCNGRCCNTDRCNNIFPTNASPSSVPGMMALKFGLGAIVVAGFFFA